MKTYVVEGGIGKHIAFSSVISSLAKEEKINILSAYPDLYFNNPKINESLTFGTPYGYDRIKDTEIICYEPYWNNKFIKGEIHIVQAWCEGYGITYNEKMKPEIYPSNKIKEDAKKFASNLGDFILIQFTGGQSPLNANLEQPFSAQGMIKAYPHAKELVVSLREKFPKLRIVNFTLPNEQDGLQDLTIRMQAPYLFYAELLRYCKSYIAIDSSLQHMSAIKGIEKPGIVLWGATSPLQFGWKHNINLTNKCNTEGCELHCMRPYLKPIADIRSDGSLWECSSPTCIDISVDEIIKNLISFI